MLPFHRKKNRQSKINIVNFAGKVSVLVYIVLIVQLFMTIAIQVGDSSNPFEVYIRNLSSIVALTFLAMFLDFYKELHIMFNSLDYMKRIQTISLILSSISFLKAIISLAFAVQYMLKTNFVFVYYLGETLIWTAVAVFAIEYYKSHRKTEDN